MLFSEIEEFDGGGCVLSLSIFEEAKLCAEGPGIDWGSGSVMGVV